MCTEGAECMGILTNDCMCIVVFCWKVLSVVSCVFQKKSSMSVGAIVGSVSGVCLLILCNIALVMWLQHRRRVNNGVGRLILQLTSCLRQHCLHVNAYVNTGIPAINTQWIFLFSDILCYAGLFISRVLSFSLFTSHFVFCHFVCYIQAASCIDNFVY